jgi:hypothetical protein
VALLRKPNLREVNVTNPLRLVLFAALTSFAISLFPTVGSAIAPTKKCATSNDCQPGAQCRHGGQGHNAKMGVCVGGQIGSAPRLHALFERAVRANREPLTIAAPNISGVGDEAFGDLLKKMNDRST